VTFESPFSALDREAEQPENVNFDEERSVVAREEGIEVENASFVVVDEFSSCIGEEAEVIF
jgi:hypothetical protein